MLTFRLFFFVIFLCSALVQADYAIDDSDNTTLTYSANPGGPVWGPFGSDTGEVLEIELSNGTMQIVDATQCYDGTFTYAACSASDNCVVQFTFTGSGITIYVLQAGPQGMSASLSIDSGAAMTATLDAPPPPQCYVPLVVLFDVQNIPSGTHTATVTVLDWNGSFSGMMLDYIVVNQTSASPTATPIPVSNPDSTQAPLTTSLGPSPNSSQNPQNLGSNTSPSPNLTPTQTSPSPSTPLPVSAGSDPLVISQLTSPTGTQTIVSVSSADVLSIKSVFSYQLSEGTTVLPPSTLAPNTPPGNGTSSSNTLSSTSNKTNVAAIVAGVVGGIVGLLALLGLVLCRIRRSRRRELEVLNERPSPLLLPQPEIRYTNIDPTNGADPFAAFPPNRLSGAGRPLHTWTPSEAGSVPNASSPARDASGSSHGLNSSHARVASSGSASATSSGPVSIAGGAIAAATPPERDTSTPNQLSPVRAAVTLSAPFPSEKVQHSGTPTRGLRQDSTDGTGRPTPTTVLTDQQVDFVNSLFNNNVPAPVVARVLERMIANPAQAIGSINDPELRVHLDPGGISPTGTQTQPPARSVQWLPTLSDHGDGETISTAPPSYDYVQAQ